MGRLSNDYSPPGGSGGSLVASSLTPTAVKTANYTAAALDLVPVDTTAGAVTITLPTAPADKTQVAVKHIIQGGTNAVTIACGGSDVLNRTGGATSFTMPLLAQAAVLQYKASGAIWYIIDDDLPLSQLDGRYLGITTAIPESQVTNLTTDLAAKAAKAANLSDLGSAATARTNLGLGGLATKSAVAVPGDVTATGTPSATTYLRGDGSWATPAGGGGGGVAEGRAKSATVTNLSLPGVQHNGNQTAATMSANRACYTGRRVLTSITVDQIVVECTTAVASCSGRFAVYAATTDWQPTGVPLIDSGTVDLSTTGIKAVTLGSAVVLPAGLYVVWTNVSTGNPGLRAVPTTPSMLGFNPASIGQGTNFMYASQTYGAPPSTPLAWDTFAYANASAEWVFLRESVA